MTATPKRPWFKFGFSIRDLFWLTAVASLAVAWWMEHRAVIRLEKSVQSSHELYDLMLERLGKDLDAVNPNWRDKWKGYR